MGDIPFKALLLALCSFLLRPRINNAPDNRKTQVLVVSAISPYCKTIRNDENNKALPANRANGSWQQRRDI